MCLHKDQAAGVSRDFLSHLGIGTITPEPVGSGESSGFSEEKRPDWGLPGFLALPPFTTCQTAWKVSLCSQFNSVQ